MLFGKGRRLLGRRYNIDKKTQQLVLRELIQDGVVGLSEGKLVFE